MSEGEVFVLIVAASFAVVGWWGWYVRLLLAPGLRGRAGPTLSLALWPTVLLLAMYLVLRGFASADVRDSPVYLAFYLILGSMWLVVNRWLAARLGLSWVDDTHDRRNPAAVLALCGALFGAAACYTGGNIGDGPGWWCVVVTAGVANLAWLAVWVVLERLAAVSEAITVERDLGASLRVGALLAACGLVAGRGAAGDWFDLGSTFVDFGRTAWPLIPLAALAVWVERSRARRPVTETGSWMVPSVALTLVYLAAGVAVVLLSPAPAENPLYDILPVEAG